MANMSQELFQRTMIECYATLAADVNIIKTDIDKIKKDVDLIKAFLMSNKKSVETVKEFTLKYAYDIPFKSTDEFFMFDEELTRNELLKSDVSNLLQFCGLDTSIVISRSFTHMLKIFLTKETARKFVAIRGVDNKYIMKKTNFFFIMEALIKKHRKNSNFVTTEKEINQALSNVLSNCGTWYKGKSFTNENMINNPTTCKNQVDDTDPSMFYLPVIDAEDFAQKVATDDLEHDPLANEDEKTDVEEDCYVVA